MIKGKGPVHWAREKGILDTPVHMWCGEKWSVHIKASHARPRGDDVCQPCLQARAAALPRLQAAQLAIAMAKRERVGHA